MAENLYDNRGVLRKAIVLDGRTVYLDAARKIITTMDIELMEAEPDAFKLEQLAREVVDQLYTGFNVEGINDDNSGIVIGIIGDTADSDRDLSGLHET